MQKKRLHPAPPPPECALFRVCFITEAFTWFSVMVFLKDYNTWFVTHAN